MLEFGAKILWFLVIGAFGIGAWVAGIQLTVANQSTLIKETTSQIEVLSIEKTKFQERLIDILGRMDERLKSIEKKLN